MPVIFLFFSSPLSCTGGDHLQLFFGNPFQFTLIAFFLHACEFIGSVQAHVFRSVSLLCKCDNSSEFPGEKLVSGFFTNFSAEAFFRTFALFEVAAHADPFIFIDVIFLCYSVNHKIAAVFFQIAVGGYNTLFVLSCIDYLVFLLSVFCVKAFDFTCAPVPRMLLHLQLLRSVSLLRGPWVFLLYNRSLRWSVMPVRLPRFRE